MDIGLTDGYKTKPYIKHYCRRNTQDEVKRTTTETNPVHQVLRRKSPNFYRCLVRKK